MKQVFDGDVWRDEEGSEVEYVGIPLGNRLEIAGKTVADIVKKAAKRVMGNGDRKAKGDK